MNIAIPNHKEQCAQLFAGDDIKEDFVELKHVLANIGAQVPTYLNNTPSFANLVAYNFLSFSIDPEFNNCIDGLVLVDLDKVKASKAKRYLGQTRE